jgi:tetratricopeptide (TPR) repeat protein
MPAPVKKRQPGLRIRPGSVREAREDAGLSLGKVAGSELSRTAIFLIEKGKARPTMATLELIASRTGKPLDFFLEDGAESAAKLPAHQVDELERRAALGLFDEVIRLGRQLLECSPAREDAARVRVAMGQAHIRLQQPEEAEAVIADARRFYELTSNKPRLIDCLLTEVAAKIQREEPAALEAAEQALALCRTLKPIPSDVEIRLLQRVAIASMQRREWRRGIEALETALALAGQMEDLTQQAMYYADLANAYQEIGEVEVAARYSRRAIALSEMLQDRYNTAVAENNLGMALTKLGELGEAERHFQRSLALMDEAKVARGKSHVLISLAELRLAQGRLEEATEACLQGIELAAEMGQEATVAEGRMWLGRIFGAQGDGRGCDREFRSAIGVFDRLQLTERATRAHAAYAEILEARGDLARAHGELKAAFAAARPDLARREVADTGQISQLA